GTVCVVGKIRDLILQLSKSSIYSTKPLKWLHKGISEGCNCLGYHMWTFIDNWSWLNGYKNRYGFVQLDLETQKRTVKKSGEWFAHTAENNGFN
ncbi:family 1 glycosylhydrolase, partial [Citrobacter freundii]|uniref:family 1 glycosylhydrolase n=1 Tax=Citrobacter freundii TaxID=546 RepID=UPI00292BBA5C